MSKGFNNTDNWKLELLQQNAVLLPCLTVGSYVCAIRHVTLSALTQIFLLALPDSRSHLTPLTALEPGDTNTGLHTLYVTHLFLIFVSTLSRVCSRHIISITTRCAMCPAKTLTIRIPRALTVSVASFR